MRPALLSLAAAAVLSGAPASGAPAQADAGHPADAGPRGDAAATHVVRIKGMKFEPAALTLRVGDEVVFENADLVPHTAVSAPAFESPVLAPGQRFSFRAVRRGELPYVCTLHVGMKGTLRVE